MHLLEKTYSFPLEREYESWVISGIESALKALSLRHAVWAVSPAEEASWPADEHLAIGCKVVGLQFKKPMLGPGIPSLSRVKWSFHNPPGQFALVVNRPEIYYCLPVFFNRAIKERALDHCLFWRPTNGHDKNAWYDNPAASTPYKAIGRSKRWGRFLELILSCEVGVKIASQSKGNSYLSGLKESMSEYLESQSAQANSDHSLYVVAIEKS